MLSLNNYSSPIKKKRDKWEIIGIILCWIFVILGVVITGVKFILRLPQVLIPKHHPRE